VHHSKDRAAQILAEAEDHLRSAAAEQLAAGAAEEDAQRAALAAFGQVKAVAKSHRPRPAEVLTTLALATSLLASAYLLLSAALGALLYSRPLLFFGRPTHFDYPVVVGVAVFGTVAIVALALLGGYVTARRRLARTGRPKPVRPPLTSLFYPGAAIVLAAFGWAEYQLLGDTSALIDIGNLVGIHGYHVGLVTLAVGSIGAAAIIAVALGAAWLLCLAAWALWQAVLIARQGYLRLRTPATR